MKNPGRKGNIASMFLLQMSNYVIPHTAKVLVGAPNVAVAS